MSRKKSPLESARHIGIFAYMGSRRMNDSSDSLLFYVERPITKRGQLSALRRSIHAHGRMVQRECEALLATYLCNIQTLLITLGARDSYAPACIITLESVNK